MAAKLRAEGQKINSELDAFKLEASKVARDSERDTIMFTYIEDQCVDANHSKCIEQHDKYKLQLEELQRRRFREFFDIKAQCAQLVHHLYDWEEPVPVNSEEQLEKAKQYLNCFRPHAQKLLEVAHEEVSILRKAQKELRRMANLKD